MFIYKTKTKAHKQCHTKWNEWENECMTKTAINKLSKYTQQQQQSTSLSHTYISTSSLSLSWQQRGNNNTAVTPPIQYACIFYRLSVGRRYLIGDTSHHQPYKLELVIIVINVNDIKGAGFVCVTGDEREIHLCFSFSQKTPWEQLLLLLL